MESGVTHRSGRLDKPGCPKCRTFPAPDLQALARSPLSAERGDRSLLWAPGPLRPALPKLTPPALLASSAASPLSIAPGAAPPPSRLAWPLLETPAGRSTRTVHFHHAWCPVRGVIDDLLYRKSLGPPSPGRWSIPEPRVPAAGLSCRS